MESNPILLLEEKRVTLNCSKPPPSLSLSEPHRIYSPVQGLLTVLFDFTIFRQQCSRFVTCAVGPGNLNACTVRDNLACFSMRF